MSDPVADGRKALNHWFGYPWYDAKTDGVRRVEVAPVKSGGGNEIRVSGEGIGALLQWAAWTAIVLVLAWVLYLLLRAYGRRDKHAAESQEHLPGGADRVEALPQAAAGYGDLLAEAEQCRQQGDYNRAIVFLFSHQLTRLDRHGRIHLARGKTNRQYLREVRPWPALGGLIEPTMIAFEEVFFGHRTLGQQPFEACWARLGEFEAMVASG